MSKQTVVINLISAIPLKEYEIELNETFNAAMEFQYIRGSTVGISVYTIKMSINKQTKKPFIEVKELEGDKFIVSNIKPLGNSADIGDYMVLADLFKQIKSKHTEPIDNFILVNSGHGSGYSMFLNVGGFDFSHQTPQSSQKPKIDLEGQPILDIEYNPFLKQRFSLHEPSFYHDLNDKDNVEFDFTGVTSLTVNELKAAIIESKITFDLTVFDCCFMQTIDTMYTLNECTNYIVAAQTFLPWLTFDYKYFKELSNSIVDSDFCSNFCKSSQKTIEDLRTFYNNVDFKGVLDNYIISCIKTNTTFSRDFFTSLISVVAFLKKYYDSKVNNYDLAKALIRAKNNSTDLSAWDLYLVDLKNLLIEFQNNKGFNYAELEQDYYNVISLFESKKIVTSVHSGQNVTTKKINGISIHFPPNIELLELNSYYRNFIKKGAQVKSKFANDSKWNLFLEGFLNAIHT